MAKTKAAESKITTAAKKYMKPSEVATFGIGLFGVALLTGWMPDYTTTFFADCVDEMEYKTGKRQEGLAYAGYGLFSKIASAFTKFLGPWLVYTWSKYKISTDPNVAYASQDDKVLSRFLMIYTIIPAIFVILQFIPILFYDMTGEKKARITAALAEKREAEKVEEANEDNEDIAG